MSSPLYHSDFKTVTVSLNYNNYEVSIINNIDKTERISKKTLIHYFAERKNNEFIQLLLPQCNSYLEFSKHFKISNNKLTTQANPDNIVVNNTTNLLLSKKYKKICRNQHCIYIYIYIYICLENIHRIHRNH